MFIENDQNDQIINMDFVQFFYPLFDGNASIRFILGENKNEFITWKFYTEKARERELRSIEGQLIRAHLLERPEGRLS